VLSALELSSLASSYQSMIPCYGSSMLGKQT